MEVGAVKQAFNNEVILLKKKLNQAKIQIIHKLTRKAKQLTEKKVPEALQEKLKRKAESAVKEVLIIKKLKPKDVAKFIVTHKGELKDFLNKPIVDNDKAYARLLLHKALQDKYKLIRNRFSNVPIQDLFMSRLERRKMKKEAKDKQKNKKKGKNGNVVNSEGDWKVEDVKMDGDENELSDGEDNELSGKELTASDSENDEANDDKVSDKDDEEKGDESDNVDDELNDNDSESEEEVKFAELSTTKVVSPEVNNFESKEEIKSPKVNKTVKNGQKVAKTTDVSPIVTNDEQFSKKPIRTKEPKRKDPEKKQKELNKNKNFNEKMHQKKANKDSIAPVIENKMVDPFFITATGENYMSVVEPRAPDEFKEEHRQGNRKLRRAVMFGYVPKIKPRQDNYRNNNGNRFNNNTYDNNSDNFRSKFNNKPDFNNSRSRDNNSRNNNRIDNRNENRDVVKEEKLHPSWEAKKKKSGILPFEGKKIVFD